MRAISQEINLLADEVVQIALLCERALADSPSKINEINFHRLCRHDYSKFHLGSFIDLTPEYIASQPEFYIFRDGFDIIHENMMFQFYGPEREEQV